MNTAKASQLLEFYGSDCSHCVRMTHIVAEVEKEAGQPILQKEVWDNEENAREMKETYGDPLRAACGGLLGVPAFYNEATGEALCGEQDYDTLLKWAKGKK